MRIYTAPAALAALLLAGCGQGETAIREELRAQLMNRCTREIAPNTSSLPAFDSGAYCGCITDKAMGERSVAELQALFEAKARPELVAQGRQAATECLAQQQGRPAIDPAPEPEPVVTKAPAEAADRARPKAAPLAPPAPRAADRNEAPRPTVRVDDPPRPRPAPEPMVAKEEPGDRL